MTDPTSTHNPIIIAASDKVVLPINGSSMLYHRRGPMQQVMDEVTLVAPTEYSVLIKGRTGTGKENIAHYIHNIHEQKKREKDPNHKEGPFIAINCGAIPPSLIGSELFGHVKGGFTGADKERKGKFDAAEGGTIFLDEIDKMPKDQQVNLLRVLQEKSFYRVGGDTPIGTNVRVIAATNQLVGINKEGKKERTLLPDLYYRLTEYQVRLPSLRNRPDDIPLLAEHFVEKTSLELEFEKPPVLTNASLILLKIYPWKGNVRELANVIKGATLRAGDGGEITPNKLGLPPRRHSIPRPINEIGQEILSRLREHFTVEDLASELGTTRRSLYAYIGTHATEASAVNIPHSVFIRLKACAEKVGVIEELAPLLEEFDRSLMRIGKSTEIQ